MTRQRPAALLGLVLTLLAGPFALEAEQKAYRVGWMITGSCPPPLFARYRAALVQGLRDQGWVVGQDVTIEHRCAKGKLDRLPAIAAELVALKVDAMIATAPPAVRAARAAAKTIPIVFWSRDPVAEGFVVSLAKPGGNLTGVSTDVVPGLYAKPLELLKETVPTATRVGVLYRAYGGPTTSLLRELPGVADALGLTLQWLEANDPPTIERAFATMVRQGADALYVPPFPTYITLRDLLVDLSAGHRLPTIYFAGRDFVEAGGLMSYGQDFLDQERRVGNYVGRVLRGAKPADLPVEQPTTFELVINLRTAKVLGLTIPPSVLIRADEIIE